MLNRRKFFKDFIGNLFVVIDEVRGNRHFKLTDLWKIDEEKFRKLILKVRDDVQIIKRKDTVFAIIPKTLEEVTLYKIETEQEFIFELVEMKFSVKAITHKLQKRFEWKEKYSFAFTRNFLLFLIKCETCVPANDIHLEELDDEKG